MNNIKELHPKEGVTLLAVKVPEGTMQLHVHHSGFLLYNKGCEFNLTLDIPEGNWQLLGTPEQITEEVWRGIMPEVQESGWVGVVYRDFIKGGDIAIGDGSKSEIIGYSTAEKSGMSFLEANEVYSVNPMEPVWDQTDANGTPYNKNFDYYSYLRAYNEAEANTGTWVIFQKL